MKKYDIGAYIWPAYSGDDPRSRLFWPEGMGEWQSVRNAVTKCDRHDWPRRPVWGYVNEGDPYVMEMEINAATDHGINVFVYDWYWYDNRPFFENCLNDGFLKARNNEKMRFYLMWANHGIRYNWDKRNATMEARDNPICSGMVSPEQFVPMTDRLIEMYFKRPNYYKINGCPVFSIYDLKNLLDSLGGLEKTRAALDGFRERCIKAGFPNLHLQIVSGQESPTEMPEFKISMPHAEFMTRLGADSITGYGSGAFTGVNIPFEDCYKRLEEHFAFRETYPMPFFPSISLGWDNNPRYPDNVLTPDIMTGRTPEKFAHALTIMKKCIDSHPDRPPLGIINAWNEWTEDNYLQPDDKFGYGMLEAVKSVFVDGKEY